MPARCESGVDRRDVQLRGLTRCVVVRWRSEVFHGLSDRGFGPRFWGLFGNGRVEGWIEARPLTPPEMGNVRDPCAGRCIAPPAPLLPLLLFDALWRYTHMSSRRCRRWSLVTSKAGSLARWRTCTHSTCRTHARQCCGR